MNIPCQFLRLSLVATALMPPGVAKAGSYKYTLLKIPNQLQSEAFGVSAKDIVVGALRNADASELGFVWAKGLLTQVDLGGAAQLDAINDKGLAAGVYGASGAQNAFVYDVATGVQTLLPTAPGRSLSVLGIRRDGKVIGFSTKGRKTRGFEETTKAIHYLEANTNATGINDAGQIVGDYVDAMSDVRGFIFQHGAYTYFDAEPGAETFPAFITSTGTVGGSYSDSNGSFGFTMTSGVTTSYAYPGAQSTELVGIGADGEIAGNYVDGSGVLHGFVFVQGVYYTIDEPAGRFTKINAVNSQGTLAGTVVVGGANVGFVARCAMSDRPCTQ